MLESIREGIVFMFKDPALRAMFILIAVANFAFGGPIIVGVPYLANTRFPEGAAAYGLIISGYAGGNLLGIILCGVLPKLSHRLFKVLSVVMFTFFGVGLGAMAWINITAVATVDHVHFGSAQRLSWYFIDHRFTAQYAQRNAWTSDEHDSACQPGIDAALTGDCGRDVALECCTHVPAGRCDAVGLRRLYWNSQRRFIIDRSIYRRIS